MEAMSPTFSKAARPRIALASTRLDMHDLLGAALAQFGHVDWCRVEDAGDPASVQAALCWHPPADLLQRLPSLTLIQSLAAGVDHLHPALAGRSGLPPVCRVVDRHMGDTMAGYVCWAVLSHHRGMHEYLAQARRREWLGHPVPEPAGHTVGLAGLGELGMACARALRTLGYGVRGWSRTPKAQAPDGVRAYHGDAQLGEFLSGCDTLVCLLPLTPSTRGILNADLFARLKPGAHLINAARGEHLVTADLLRALDGGTLAAATLDAFEQEPLAEDDPLWRHPRITITPHIGARTPFTVILRQTLENLACVRAGRAPGGLVDLAAGY